MPALAAVMTPRGTGAIATILLCGNNASSILADIFRPSSAIPGAGRLAVGRIVSGERTIDQVVLACEAEGCYAINCHGSPLVVDMLVELLGSRGAESVDSRDMMRLRLSSDSSLCFLAVEAALTQLEALTINGTKLIASQLKTGLLPTAQQWLKAITSGIPDSVKQEAAAILDRSRVARFMISGAKVVIAGPPNSGKSTLLNRLTGRSKSIVADIPGTTRDYVSAHFTSPSLAMEIFDTAGIDHSISKTQPDQAAQKQANELLMRADLVLLVLDSTRPLTQFDVSILGYRPTVTIMNKRDLVPINLPGTISISAIRDENIASVIAAIHSRLGIDKLELSSPCCFTARQEHILRAIAQATAVNDMRSLITQLINGPSGV